MIRILLLLFLFSGQLIAEPLNLRYPSPSPDGSQLCFSYHGDLWVVPSAGGNATRLTVHVGYDAYPVWSPDGKYIAFSSDRFGSLDIFLISAEGGEEYRLTYHSADDIVTGWTSDSKKIIFSSQREFTDELIYQISFKGGNPQPLTMTASKLGRVSDDNKELLFTKGKVPWSRKGYRGSADCDIYIKNLENNSFKQLTQFEGNDLEAFWFGDSILYLSDSTGSYNIFCRDLINNKTTQVTRHRMNVSHPSLAEDGSLLAYELGGEIFLYDFKLSKGRKLKVNIISNIKQNQTKKIIYNSGLTEFKISPNGLMIAYVVHGELFCMDINGETQRQITNSPAEDCQISWSADSRELAFCSNRQGNFDIYTVASTDIDIPYLYLSHDREIKKVVDSDKTEGMPTISHDGSKVVYVRSQTELIITDRKGITKRYLAEQRKIGSYDWSNDSRYIVFTLYDSNWYSDIYIGDTESGKVVNITSNPGNYSKPYFSTDGRLVYFIKDGDVHYIFLEKKFAEMSSVELNEYDFQNGKNHKSNLVNIDFENIWNRMVKLTDNLQVTDVALSPNSKRFVFAASKRNLWQVNLDGTDLSLLTSEVDEPQMLQFGVADNIAFFADADGKIYSIDLEEYNFETYSYSAEVRINQQIEYIQIFRETWQLLKEHFYDKSYHGIDWDDIKKRYRERVEVVIEERDFHDIIREMVGELNASHLDIWAPKHSGDETGYLGVIPDFEDNSTGLRIAEIIPGSPAAKQISKLKINERLMKVNNRSIKSKDNYYKYLEGIVGKQTKLELVNRDGIPRWVVITPINKEQYQALLYKDLIEKRRKQVKKISDKKIAYIHIGQLNQAGLEQFHQDLKVYASDKNGLIIDIRDNPGGSAHDQLLNMLSRNAYVSHQPRLGISGFDSDAIYQGQIVLLINEGTSSDAEIFAHGFRELGLGKIVGVTTYGAVIGTEKRAMLDGSTFTVPSVGWYTISGENLENKGIEPDVKAEIDLARLEKGEDTQLERAISVLKKMMK